MAIFYTRVALFVPPSGLGKVGQRLVPFQRIDLQLGFDEHDFQRQLEVEQRSENRPRKVSFYLIVGM